MTVACLIHAAQAPNEEEGGVPEVAAEQQEPQPEQQPEGAEQGKADTGAAAAERGLKKLQG